MDRALSYLWSLPNLILNAKRVHDKNVSSRGRFNLFLTSLFCWNSGSSGCSGYARELWQGTHIPSIYQHQKDFSKYCCKSSCKSLWAWLAPLFLTSIILTTITNQTFSRFTDARRFSDSPASTKRLGEACWELYVQSFLPNLSVKLPRFPQFCLLSFLSSNHIHTTVFVNHLFFHHLLSCKLFDGMRSRWILIFEVERSNIDI